MLHITRRRDATSNTLQLRPGPQSYNNSKQQSKRYKANSTATATRSPEARPAAPTCGTAQEHVYSGHRWGGVVRETAIPPPPHHPIITPCTRLHLGPCTVGGVLLFRSKEGSVTGRLGWPARTPRKTVCGSDTSMSVYTAKQQRGRGGGGGGVPAFRPTKAYLLSPLEG